jgi:L-ascorbate metabolism protein UlaG (beta-lactamase superfamily)
MKTQNIFIVLIFLFISFFSCNEKCSTAPVINAGTDTIIFNAESVTLNAKTDAGSGSWKIVSGTDGVLADANSSHSLFSGSINNSYTLVWESTNDCGTSIDTLKIGFQSKLTVDQMVDSLVWIQQSCFRMKGTGVTIYFDPQAIKANSKPADYILITHSHGDHFAPGEIKKIATEKTVIYGPASCKYTGVCKEFITVLPGDIISVLPNLQIKAVAAYNIVRASWHPKAANNVGFVVTLDGVTVYHAGDTERIPEMKDIDCDIALLPLGQTYTMVSVADAAESAKDVKAEVAIPMHYGSAEGTAKDAETFKSLLEGQIKVVIKTRE